MNADPQMSDAKYIAGDIHPGFQGERRCLLSLIRRSQRVGGVYIASRSKEGVREGRDLYVRTV
jgi:hypothetical protein